MKSINEQVKESLAFWVRHWMAMAAKELDRRALECSANAQDLRGRARQLPPPKK